MKIKENIRTCQTLHISDVWQLCLQNLEQKEFGYYISKTAKTGAENPKWPAKILATSETTNQQQSPESFNLIGVLLFLIVIFCAAIPKSFLVSLFNYLTQTRAEALPLAHETE